MTHKVIILNNCIVPQSIDVKQPIVQIKMVCYISLSLEVLNVNSFLVYPKENKQF